MALTETDYETIEAFLDGEMSDDELSAVRSRIDRDAAFAAAVDEASASHQLRAAVWPSLEPSNAEVQRLQWRIEGAMAAENRPAVAKNNWSIWRLTRIASAAAACVVVGFSVGWIGRGSHQSTPVVVSSPSSLDGSIASNDTPGTFTPTGTVAPVMNNGNFNVPVTDDYGRVVAWQPFRSNTDAAKFVEDLHKANAVRPADDKVKLVGDEKF